MRTMKFFSSMLFLFFLISMISCEKERIDETSEPTISSTSSRSLSSSDEIREVFGETLVASLVAEPALGEFLSGAIRKMQKTDYEVIYLAEKDKLITDVKTFADIMKENADASVFQTYGQDFFHTNGKIDPLLSISLPDLDKRSLMRWDGVIIPDVATIYDNELDKFRLFSENGTSSLIVMTNDDTLEALLNKVTLSIMDAEGYYLVKPNLQLYDSDLSLFDFMPRLPRVDGTTLGAGGPTANGINPCEEILLEATVSFTQYEITGEQYYLAQHNTLIEQYQECIGIITGGGEGGGPTGGTPANCDKFDLCERDCPLETAAETLVDFKINDWGVFTSIRNQPFENRYKFHADIAYGVVAGSNAFGETAQMVTSSYRKRDLLNCSNNPCVGKFKTQDYEIWRDWQLTELAEPYHVQWSEVDNTQTKFSIKLPFKVKFKAKDPTGTITTEYEVGIEPSITIEGDKTVLLGDQRIFYCDPIMQEEDTGSITFRCN